MGWVKPRTGRDGSTQYTAVYRDLQGRERSAGTWNTEKRAVREWHKAEEALRSGKVSDSALGHQTLQHYVENKWLAHHVMELTTRENYIYTLNRYILPELGKERLGTLLPDRIREWITTLQSSKYHAKPPTIQKAKIVLDAILSTAFHDGVAPLHAGRGVKIPPVATKPRRIITVEQYDHIHTGLGDEAMQLLVETDIESGLRWGELTELRPSDINFTTGVATISRAVVQLKARDRPGGRRFVVKDYPKDKEWRQIKLAPHLVVKIEAYVAQRGLGPDDLLFEQPQPVGARRLTVPEELPDADTLGLTEPNEKGRQYRHGTMTAYGLGKCRCRHCKNAVAVYRAGRRAKGQDAPRRQRTVDSDGHISNAWFRTNIWNRAIDAAKLGFRVTPHDLRHAHASWLLAGGADLQVVKERLGHGSITTTGKYLHTLPDAQDSALEALEAIRGNRGSHPTTEASTNEGSENSPSSSISTTPDQRDAELAQMRAMVAKLSEMLGSLGTTA